MKKKIVVANWKMNGNKILAKKITNVFKTFPVIHQTVICPPFTLIDYVRQILPKNHNLIMGAQDCCDDMENTSRTGSISALMLAEVGCRYVILGHTERRTKDKESDTAIKHKIKAALSVGITPIVCIDQRTSAPPAEALRQEYENLTMQSKIIIAYEPSRAIGTGIVPHITTITENVEHIKKAGPSLGVLYGGSVNGNNVKSLLNICDGVLVGKASLDPDQLPLMCGAK